MSKKVLIAEDVSDVLMMMKILVKTHGFEPIIARDGCEAIEKAKEHKPDVILMDLMMPVMDGVTAARIIKQNKNLRHVPILAVTAFGDTCLEKISEIGFEEVIAKPLDFENLKPLLKKYTSI